MGPYKTLSVCCGHILSYRKPLVNGISGIFEKKFAIANKNFPLYFMRLRRGLCCVPPNNFVPQRVACPSNQMPS